LAPNCCNSCALFLREKQDKRGFSSLFHKRAATLFWPQFRFLSGSAIWHPPLEFFTLHFELRSAMVEIEDFWKLPTANHGRLSVPLLSIVVACWCVCVPLCVCLCVCSSLFWGFLQIDSRGHYSSFPLKNN